MRLSALLAPALITTLSGSAIAGPDVRVFQSTDPAMTEGETLIEGAPATVFASVLDYRKWTDIFPDISKVVVTAQHGVDARVTLISPTGHHDNIHFHNQPAARMIFFEDTGNGGRAEVWAEIVFAATPQANVTRVHIRLYAEVKGIASIVVSEKSVRQQRETKIENDLTHIRAYFHRSAGSVAQTK